MGVMNRKEVGGATDWKRELAVLASKYPTSYNSCLENTQDMGMVPLSDEEDREVLSQLRNLIDAGEAS